MEQSTRDSWGIMGRQDAEVLRAMGLNQKSLRYKMFNREKNWSYRQKPIG